MRRRDPITELRQAIDQLPMRTRVAMLTGIREDKTKIICGAYTDNDGGMCPMLAAHRRGGRANLLEFAKSWDGFAGTGRVRRATRRELTVLESQLVQSLEEPGHSGSLGSAIAEHLSLRKRREVEPVEVVEPVAAPAKPVTPVAEEQIRAARLTPGRVSRLRPRRAAAERALANLDEHVLAHTR